MPFQLQAELLPLPLYISCVLLRSYHPWWMSGWVVCYSRVHNEISSMKWTHTLYILSFNHQAWLGYAGQNTAIDPSLGCSSSWCASPLFIWLCISHHWQEALKSCLYRFYRGKPVHWRLSTALERNVNILRHFQGTCNWLCFEALNSIAGLWSYTPNYQSRSHPALRRWRLFQFACSLKETSQIESIVHP